MAYDEEFTHKVASTPGRAQVVSRLFNVSPCAIKKWRIKYGLQEVKAPPKPVIHSTRKNKYYDMEFKRKVAETPGRVVDVALQFGVNKVMVSVWRKRLGIVHPRAPRAEKTSKKRKTQLPISNLVLDLCQKVGVDPLQMSYRKTYYSKDSTGWREISWE